MREHAVVLGASMAGLLAARALSGVYRRITLIERDVLPDGASPRKGVPQSLHPHALLPSGSAIMDAMFPGLLAELVAHGAPKVSDLDRIHFEVKGHVICKEGAPPADFYLCTRPLLEDAVRRRVLPLVTLRQNSAAEGVTVENDRVTGVIVREGTTATEIAADLVVDATGRSGKAASWLSVHGYPQPHVETIDIDVLYATAHVRMPNVGPDFDEVVVVGASPEKAYGGAVFRQEAGLWLFLLYGYRGNHPPTDRDGMLRLATELFPQHWAQALVDAEWSEPIHTTRYPASVRRRWDRVDRAPKNYLVLGDALCSFNPIFGQGMTVAAMEAQELRRALRGPDAGLRDRFYKGGRKHIDTAWQLGAGGDLSYPMVEGNAPAHMAVLNSYVDRVLAAAASDPVVAAAFLGVVWMIAPPTALASPKVLARVGRQTVRGPGR